ncbi:PPC domain-containing DNA-binding protein [Methanopyrus sp.]
MEPGERFPESVNTNRWRNSIVVSGKGSVRALRWRLGDTSVFETRGKFELISLEGLLFDDGSYHLHASVSDENGHTLSGHVKGFEVYTTVELVLLRLSARLEREHDPHTGHMELARVIPSARDTRAR